MISNSAGDGVTLADNNTLTGFDVEGCGDAGIFGNGVSALTISNVNCRENGTHGIHVVSLAGNFTFEDIGVFASGDDNIYLDEFSGNGLFTDVRSDGAGDDGFDCDGATGNLDIVGGHFNNEADDGVDLNAISGTFNFNGVAFSDEVENSLEVTEPNGATLNIDDCTMYRPGYSGVCIDNPSGSLTGSVTGCTITESGSDGIFAVAYDQGSLDMTIGGTGEKNTIEDPGHDDDNGIYIIIDNTSTNRLLVLDNDILQDNDDESEEVYGLIIEAYDGTLNALVDNNLFRDFDQGGQGFCVYAEGSAVVNVGITNNRMVDNSSDSDIEAEGSSTICVRVNDNDTSQDPDPICIDNDNSPDSTINVETPSGNSEDPDETNTTPVGPNTCTDIPTR